MYSKIFESKINRFHRFLKPEKGWFSCKLKCYILLKSGKTSNFFFKLKKIHNSTIVSVEVNISLYK